jgi:regulator of protease activity HflC (stomatin/prohibitin superfamily)
VLKITLLFITIVEEFGKPMWRATINFGSIDVPKDLNVALLFRFEEVAEQEERRKEIQSAVGTKEAPIDVEPRADKRAKKSVEPGKSQLERGIRRKGR